MVTFVCFSYKKKDADLSVAQGRIKDLEVLFHRSEAELNTVLNEKRSLEAEVADLRAQLAKVSQRVLACLSTAGVTACEICWDFALSLSEHHCFSSLLFNLSLPLLDVEIN